MANGVTGQDQEAAPGLSREELVRYGRHLSLGEVGLAGQERIRAARVAVVGLGGLGSPVVQYLAAAGIGQLGLIDGDRVELSNLQRQVLYGVEDVGRPKVDAAADRVARLNPNVRADRFAARLDSTNALEILAGYDIVVDGTDNFPTRYLVNDACSILRRPSVHGSVLRFEGRLTVFAADGAPCYRCLYPEPPPPGSVPDCEDAGVLGVLPGLIGLLQATEVLKLACGIGDSMAGRMLLVDARGPRFHTMQLQRDPACPACGTRSLDVLQDYEAFCGVTAPGTVELLEPAALRRRLGPGVQLVDVREPWEWAICRLPGAQLIPLGTLPSAGALDPARETIVYCHHGSRSLHAATWLLGAGFRRVAHLEGGIDRWSREVDPGVARY